MFYYQVIHHMKVQNVLCVRHFVAVHYGNERVVTEYFSKKEYWPQILNMCNLLRDLGVL